METKNTKHIATTTVTRFLLKMVVAASVVLLLAHFYVDEYRTPKEIKEATHEVDSVKTSPIFDSIKY